MSAADVITDAVALRPSIVASVVPAGAVERLLDPAQQEHLVVHAEAEHHREHQHRHDHEDRLRWARRGRRPRPHAVLEHQHDQPERGAHREGVHDDRLDRHQHRAERDREHDRGGAEDQADQQRKAVQQVVLEVERRGGVAADADRHAPGARGAALCASAARALHHVHGAVVSEVVSARMTSIRARRAVAAEVGVEEARVAARGPPRDRCRGPSSASSEVPWLQVSPGSAPRARAGRLAASRTVSCRPRSEARVDRASALGRPRTSIRTGWTKPATPIAESASRPSPASVPRGHQWRDGKPDLDPEDRQR